jgi:hypothetical protein
MGVGRGAVCEHTQGKSDFLLGSCPKATGLVAPLGKVLALTNLAHKTTKYRA